VIIIPQYTYIRNRQNQKLRKKISQDWLSAFWGVKLPGRNPAPAGPLSPSAEHFRKTAQRRGIWGLKFNTNLTIQKKPVIC
jgi:hypothetical protein